MNESQLDAIVLQLKNSGEKTSEIFCTQLKILHEGLSLTIDPVGNVPFPVSARMAKSLIVEAELARFGLKDKTLFDRSIRDTWEIEKDRIHVNRSWVDQLQLTLRTIKKDLNLPDDGELRADLHNLLIYMPGQFFKAHQDSEKSDGMLATLVITLPSEFTGGALIVDQHGDRKIFEATSSDKNLSFVAFYADCIHEVTEVISGYRLTLTYNLFFKPASTSFQTRKNTELNKAVRTYFSQPSSESSVEGPDLGDKRPLWLVYLLDHEYTQSSLDWQNLRGKDRDRVSELLACADHLNMTAHLVLADIHESWSTEGGDWGRGYRNHFSYEKNIEKTEPVAYELSELFQNEIILRRWITRTGKKFMNREQHVSKDMVCWTKAVDDFQPFRSEYEGFMGNYGNTLDRWYHRAAIVLWNKELDLINVFICDKTEALRLIGEILNDNIEAGREAVRQTLPYWPDNIHRILDPALVLDLANRVLDEELAASLVKTLGIGILKEKHLQPLIKIIGSYGEDWFIPILDFWRKHYERESEDSTLKESDFLADQFSSKYKKISHWLLKDRFLLLIQNDASEEKYLGRREIREKVSKRLRAIEILINVSRSADEMQIHDKLIGHALGKPNLYSEVELAFLFMQLDQIFYSKALSRLKARLKRQIATPRKEGDWAIGDSIPDYCSDCQYLENFLRSSTTQKIVWPLSKNRRQHIHQIIDAMDIPVSHETIRKGSPHKLELIKNSALFAKDSERVKIIENCLNKLRNLKLDRS